ncbi:hypothetical protein JCM30237_19250 [Halolamina litorea]|uniref:Uncharacterized protein n=1 Tax=Halolamina litorea TaxID=1515593 RepID=A0ABD6BU77_9EURY|nr:hypothetical protein [Halolamina litorea]
MAGQTQRSRLARLRRWVLVTGDRQAVTATLLLAGYLLVAPVGHALLPHGPHLGGRDATVPLLNTMLSGTFLIFSIVVSINSLFISGEQSPLDQQFGRVQSVVEFRRQLGEVIDADHVPASPGPLVRTLSGEILERAQRLEDELDTADADVRENTSAYVADLAAETGRMNAGLDDASSPLSVTVALADYNHDRQINDLRRLRADHADVLSADAEAAIDELLGLLQYFAAARQYFKTLYTKSEFASLSRWLVLTSVPAVAITATFLHYLAWTPDSHLLVAGIEAVSFAPFLLVASYILRVTTISRQTWAAGQFVATKESGGAIDGIDRE